MNKNQWKQPTTPPELGPDNCSNYKECITKYGKFRLAYYDGLNEEWCKLPTWKVNNTIEIMCWRDIDLPQ